MSEPKIEVTVQREHRERAIADLCRAIRVCAEALGQGVMVTVKGCTIINQGKSPGIYINTEEDVHETHIATPEKKDPKPEAKPPKRKK